MSFTAERHEVEFCPGHGLRVCQCGWQKCDANHHCGPRFYQHYSMTFILKGRGRYTVDEETHELKAGEGFAIFPGKRTYYIADAKEPWEYIYVIFYGMDAGIVLETVGLGERNLSFAYPDSDEFLKLLQSMHQASKGGEAQGFDVLGYFLLVISHLIRAGNSQRDLSAPQEQYVRKAIAYMQANYTYDISVSEVASYVGIERSYLYKLFRNQVGQSPVQWLTNHRLEEGHKLLESSDFSVTDIAHSLGFFDVSHFSHAYRRKYGCTPTQYRKSTEKKRRAEE